ncbi:MAG: DUF4124 domain-containing protein [Betaproteobacteria bacterium]
MKRFVLYVAILLTSTAASAQIYQWKDENGKTIISDKPPVGHSRIQRKADAEAPAAATTAPQKSLADRELEFRKRQKDSQEKEEKAKKDENLAAQKQENCANLSRQLRSLESGERIALRNDQGERYFLEDAQREQEIAKARENYQSMCQ